MRRVTQVASVLILVVSVLGCGRSPSGSGVGANVDPKVKADELAALAGTWVYDRQVVEGKEIADMGRSNIVISGDTLTRDVYSADGQRLNPIKSTIWVDPTTSPKQMDDDATMPVGKRRRLGIYKFDGDRLTLCYDNTGAQRPTTFDSPAGSSLVLSVLRRQGK